jgi:transposase
LRCVAGWRGWDSRHDDLVEALDGMFDDHHGELAGPLVEQIAFLDDRIARLSARAAAMPAAWGINADGTTGPDAGTGPDAPALNAVARLAQIPGIREDQARTIIAETGLDMSRFPTAAHLVSWAGLCPSTRQSGPRTRAGKKGQGNAYLRGALGQAAIGAAGTAGRAQGHGHRPCQQRWDHLRLRAWLIRAVRVAAAEGSSWTACRAAVGRGPGLARTADC